MKRIGILTPFHDNYGGGEIFLQNIAKYCNEKENEIEIIIFSSDVKAFDKYNVLIPKINSYKLFLHNYIDVCRIIKQYNIQFLILNDFFISQFALLFRCFFKNVVSLLHGEITYNNVDNYIEKKMIILFRRLAISVGTKKIFSVNKTNIEYFSSKKIYYIGNFIVPVDCERNLEEEYDFIYVGRFTKLKNIFRMIDVYKKYCEKYNSEAKFVMVGMGELFEDVKVYIRDKGIDKNVQLIGFVEHNKIIEMYKKSRCLLLFSQTEGFPTVILEALECGIPCIVSNVGSNKEVIIDYLNGFCFDLSVPDDKIVDMMNYALAMIDGEKCKEQSRKYHIDIFWKKFCEKLFL